MKYFILCLFLFSINCASKKQDVTNTDIKRVIEKVAVLRVQNRIYLEEGMLPKTDREIFLEVCNIFRLNSDSALQKIEATHPEIYPLLKGSP